MTAAVASPPDTAVVRCVGLTKTFKDFWMRNRVAAVQEIDLDIRRGEVFGLLGPNGSGKSTTIKMILGLLHATSGKIAVFGQHPRDVKTKEKIGYLPEESYLYKFLNARETLDYYARLFHQNRSVRKQRIDQLLEYVGLDKVARRPIGEYSKGMQRRIGLAQALINDPQLLILDEPTTGMDPIGTRQIKDLILDLRQRGKTILLCSHLLSDVQDVCDRAAIMFGGKVARCDTMEKLLEADDHTTVTLPTLDEGEQEKLLAALEQRGLTQAEVRQAKRPLESLFLEIVHEQQSRGATTSGAGSGGQIAAFLGDDEERGAHMPEDRDAHELLDSLTTPTTPEQTPTPVTEETAAPEPSDLADNVLDGLVTEAPKSDTPARPTSTQPVSPPPAKQEDDADDDLLDSLTK